MAWRPAARIPAETPKAVNVRLARETMEPRQTEFTSQGRHSCQSIDAAAGTARARLSASDSRSASSTSA